MAVRPWRMAKTLDVLLDEIDARSPKRSRRSDGGIGDAAHATRTSDHNPWILDGANGVVSARDFTHDPNNEFDAHAFAEWLRGRCKSGAERRVKYIISNRRIASSVNSWSWRPYSGTNPHTQHVHISVESTKTLYDNTASWGWRKPVTPAKPSPAKPAAKGPQGLDTKVTLTAPAAAYLSKETGDKRKAGDVLSLRYIVTRLGKK